MLPNLEVPECPEAGVWGERRRKYLREHQKALYTAMMLSDTLSCSLCTAYEHKAFIAGLQYGAYLIKELATEQVVKKGSHS